MQEGWIGVDLDGTLVRRADWRDLEYIGLPIPAMRDRVKAWLDEGRDVRIFTARVAPLFSPDASRAERLQAQKALWAIEDWCTYHFGEKLPVTAVKDFGMALLYDDRCIPVEADTGRLLIDETVWDMANLSDMRADMDSPALAVKYPPVHLWNRVTGQTLRVLRRVFAMYL